MKSKLLIMAALCAIAFHANAQTKGTNAVSFGVTSQTITTANSITNGSTENKNNLFTLGYGHFINDNSKIGLELTYGLSKYNNSSNSLQEFKSFGANASYQKYYPIVKTLFAYAGGKGGYTSGKQSSNSINQSQTDREAYAVGAYGGLTWFVSKRFAFETNLLSANATYSIDKQKDNSTGYTNQTEITNFNLTSQGFINDLGFKIYLLF